MFDPEDHIPAATTTMSDDPVLLCSCGWDSENPKDAKVGWLGHLPDSLAADVLRDVREVAREVGFTEPPPLVHVTGNWYAMDSLDTAWSDAEAALPEGWWFTALSRGYDGYAAKAHDGTSHGDHLATLERGYGSTPAAALRALTAQLRERAG